MRRSDRRLLPLRHFRQRVADVAGVDEGVSLWVMLLFLLHADEGVDLREVFDPLGVPQKLQAVGWLCCLFWPTGTTRPIAWTWRVQGRCP